jgi:hypothetical protein
VVLDKLDRGKTAAQALGSFDSNLSRYEGEILLGRADLGRRHRDECATAVNVFEA